MKAGGTLIISPHYPPLVSGLSDYTSTFIKHLPKEQNLFLVTQKESHLNERLSGSLLLDSWKFVDSIKLFLYIVKLKKAGKIDNLLIQYVPYMYGRAGINFFFPLCIFFVSFFMKELQIDIMFHEMHYPKKYSLKELVIYYSHRIMLFFLAYSSHRRFLSTEFALELFNSYFPLLKKTSFFLPVGSNILASSNKERSVEGKLKFIHFGSFHQTKCAKALFSKLSTIEDKNFEVHFIGVDEKKALEYFGDELFKKLQSWCFFEGKLSESDVADFMKSSHLFLGFFLDGVSARRGSMIAAIRYGLNVITTKTHKTDPFLIEGPLFVVNNELDQFVDKLLILAKEDHHFFNNRQESVTRFYRQYFSWEKIVQGYLNEEVQS